MYQQPPATAGGGATAVADGRGGAPIDEVTARQVRIAQLFDLRLGTGLKTSAAKHTLVPTKCLSTDTKCNVTQTQAKNDYVLTPEELEGVTVRQNKKRKFYCPAELDAVGIRKYGFQKFLRKKFRSSAGVKTAEKNLSKLRELEAKAPQEDCVTAAKHAITFLTLKAQNAQAALAEASKQFRLDFPKEAEEFLPAPKANARLLKKEVQAVTSALKAKFKEKIEKIKLNAKQAKKQARTKTAGGGAVSGARQVCKRCGSADHVRSSKKQCPKYKPRAAAGAKGGKRPAPAKGTVVTATAVPSAADADNAPIAMNYAMDAPSATKRVKKTGKKGDHPAL
eukprot:INCI1507.1.p1 GENE.INCI1507.1~~INCI1507.1.p1  ORF type:complete len:337 (-),score=81.68 INCI1507.1:281-1291(-)